MVKVRRPQKSILSQRVKHFMLFCGMGALASQPFMVATVLADHHKEAVPNATQEPDEKRAAEGKQTRQRPGKLKRRISYPPFIYESVPDINSTASDFVTTPNRWRQFYVGKWYDPYNQNELKGDVPLFGAPGHEWFLELGLISDSLVERNKIALPVGGPSSTAEPDRLNTIGNGTLKIAATNLVPKFSFIRGNTTFKPPEYEFRVTPVMNFNYVEAEESGILKIDPAHGKTRYDHHLGFLELFADVHLANLTDRYDFVSSRAGIQTFQSDFRGFVYNDSQPGARLFGNFDNNKWQGNLAWFHRLDKETNSNVNTNFNSRHENVLIANAYRQDALFLGHQVQGSILYRADRAGDYAQHFDDNGFLRRPAAYGDERAKNIYNWYFGLNGDGHIGRVNTTTAMYYVVGRETHNPLAGQEVDINAGMFAQELSYDIDFVRLRSSFMWASGDSDPFDSDATGFDAINDVPNFAGGDLSYWQRQALPLIAGGETFLVNNQSLLPNLRPNKQEGQSNFVNPGLWLYNLGLDIELTPKAKFISNASYLQFDQTGSLKAIRQDGSFGGSIGYDISAGFIYRPFLNNNIKFLLGTAMLIPSSGIKTLYGNHTLYHGFTNMVLEY
jgi:hypothetical protein